MNMRILVVGAGAIGGYFGGRLLAAGRDVTFLVRTRRAAQLAKTGLIIRSPFGDANVPAPPRVTADAIRIPFDLILLSCKAYDLEIGSKLVCAGGRNKYGDPAAPQWHGPCRFPRRPFRRCSRTRRSMPDLDDA